MVDGPLTPTVVIDDVHVTYRLGGPRLPGLRSLFASGGTTVRAREVLAVRGVDFTAWAGDYIGVIGRNGSGKSTLLRAIAGLLPTTSGSIRVAAQPRLLGVGAALKGDLSGRENILLGGTALGMKRANLVAATDDIIEFAGLEASIDRSFRTYSSGMKARLHFAIATAVRPDILLIDEALAVGDEEFRRRSRDRIRALLEDAATVFLVSHSLRTVREECTRAIWMDAGEARAQGGVDEVVAAYERAVG